MRRVALVLAVAFGAAGCAPTYQYVDIEGSDSESRYPVAVREARDGLARAAALALVLFAGWLVVDVARRGAEQTAAGRRRLDGGGTGRHPSRCLLRGSHLGSSSSGPAVPGGHDHRLLARPAALAIGATWVLWAFEHHPAGRGESTWGLFIIVFGVVMTPMVLLGAVALLTGT